VSGSPDISKLTSAGGDPRRSRRRVRVVRRHDVLDLAGRFDRAGDVGHRMPEGRVVGRLTLLALDEDQLAGPVRKRRSR
jgi:hypothetical protein